MLHFPREARPPCGEHGRDAEHGPCGEHGRIQAAQSSQTNSCHRGTPKPNMQGEYVRTNTYQEKRVFGLRHLAEILANWLMLVLVGFQCLFQNSDLTLPIAFLLSMRFPIIVLKPCRVLTPTPPRTQAEIKN